MTDPQDQAVTYAGIATDKIVEALIDVELLLKTVLTNREAWIVLDNWFYGETLGRLRQAENAAEFDRLLHETGTLNILNLFHDVIKLHAMIDDHTPHPDDGKPADIVYKSIAVWGGFDFPVEYENKAIEQYVEAYYIATAMQHIAPAVITDENSPGYRRYCNFMIDETYNYKAHNSYTEAQIRNKNCNQKFLDLYEKVLHRRLIEAEMICKSLTADEKNYLRGMAEAFLGLNYKADYLASISPFERFYITVPEDEDWRNHDHKVEEYRSIVFAHFRAAADGGFIRGAQSGVQFSHLGERAGVSFQTDLAHALSLVAAETGLEIYDAQSRRLAP